MLGNLSQGRSFSRASNVVWPLHTTGVKFYGMLVYGHRSEFSLTIESGLIIRLCVGWLR